VSEFIEVSGWVHGCAVDVEVLSVRVHRGEWVSAWVCSGCA
jgi:hypothetical protein